MPYELTISPSSEYLLLKWGNQFNAQTARQAGKELLETYIASNCKKAIIDFGNCTIEKKTTIFDLSSLADSCRLQDCIVAVLLPKNHTCQNLIYFAIHKLTANGLKIIPFYQEEKRLMADSLELTEFSE